MSITFDLIALAVIGILGTIGYRRGFLEELGRILSLLVATIIAVEYSRAVASWIQTQTGVEYGVASLVTFLTLFFSFLFIIRLLTKMLQVFMLAKGIRWANSTLGLIFGGLKGILSVMVILWLVDLAPNPDYFSKIRTRSYVYRNLTDTRKWIVNAFNLRDPVNRSESWVKDKIGMDRDILD